MVGPERFELSTSCTPCKRATRLRYGPIVRTVSKPHGRARRKPDSWEERFVRL